MESKRQGAMSHNLQSTILVVMQNNSLVSFPFFELSSAVTGEGISLEIDDERERERDRGGNCFITRSVTGDGKAVIYAKCKAAAVIANCAQVFHST